MEKQSEKRHVNVPTIAEFRETKRERCEREVRTTRNIWMRATISGEAEI